MDLKTNMYECIEKKYKRIKKLNYVGKNERLHTERFK